MSQTHYRSASATERRPPVNGTHSRSASARARDYERPSVRDNGSPVLSDGIENMSDIASAARKFQLEERRRHQTTTTTTETQFVRRSPIKDSWSAANRRTTEVRRRSVVSPEPKRSKEPTTVQWNPIAKLKSHSSAPLASRISVVPVSRDAPEDLIGRSVAHLDMPGQEQVVMDDMLFIFMGYEGQYVRFDAKYDPADEKQRLTGPAFRLPTGLDSSLHDLTQSMLVMASHYSAIEAFVEIQSREEYGSVNHALCAAIRQLLKDYLILVAQLENKVIEDQSFTLHQMHLSVIPTAQSLSQLYAVAQELLRKNDLIDEDLDESIDEWDAEKAIERLGAAGELLPGSGTKKKCIGGNVLALLTQRLATYSGDPAARSILEMLLREASRPYMTMLNEWLHHGGVRDPHAEFLIEEKSSINRQGLDEDFTDEYWDKRYSIRPKAVPPQLDAVKDKVLLAGKYLNVVRECGGVNVTSSIDNTPSAFDDPRFLDNVNNAYSFANSELLKLLLSKNSLRSRLRSMKHYFFLDRAEFFLYFLELSSSELQKPHSSVNVGKLQSLLDLVMYQPGSIAVAEPFKEDVKINMNRMGLTQWLMEIVNVQGMDPDNPDMMVEQPRTQPASSKDAGKEILGIEALELDYSVPFPLSLIISRKTVVRYQFIFRYTLALRQLESKLIDSWTVHNKSNMWAHKSSNRQLEGWKRRAWNLRSRMLVFVQQMLFYATAEVIEPNWQKLMAKIDAAEAFQKGEEDNLPVHRRSRRTVDELMQDHLDMLDSCTKDLGLTQAKLLRVHSKLMVGCTAFANFAAYAIRDLLCVDPDFSFFFDDPSSAETERVRVNYRQYSARDLKTPDPNQIQLLEDQLSRHEVFFNRHLKVLIEALNYFAATETVVLLGLCARLTNAEVQKRDT